MRLRFLLAGAILPAAQGLLDDSATGVMNRSLWVTHRTTPNEKGAAVASRMPAQAHSRDTDRQAERKAYMRFVAMIATATAVMYALTYTNVFAFSHIKWSEERLYMSLLMGAAMALIMLGFMWHMHKNLKINSVIIVVSLALMGLSLFLSRSQALVDDDAYMKGMIPHHSIAILTSERADIDDLRVRKLADGIIESQRREIAEMDWLLDDIDEKGEARTPSEASTRPVPHFEVSP